MVQCHHVTKNLIEVTELIEKQHYLKKVKFVKVFLDIKKDYELSVGQALLYGFIYNRCIEVNDCGYCGYSDEMIAETLGTAIATHKRDLKTLIDKELIYIVNSGSRSKRKGKSRELHINEKIFLSDTTREKVDGYDELNNENKRLLETIDALNKQIEQLQLQNMQLQHRPKLTYLSKYLIDLGYVTKKEYMVNWSEYNSMLEGYCASVGIENVKKGLSYVVSKMSKDKKIVDKVAYLSTALENSAHRINLDLNMYEDYE